MEAIDHLAWPPAASKNERRTRDRENRKVCGACQCVHTTVLFRPDTVSVNVMRCPQLHTHKALIGQPRRRAKRPGPFRRLSWTP